MKEILDFVKKLSNISSSEEFANPYVCSNKASNLKEYLLYSKSAGSDILLIGEAPGYRGCKITGIPFTSQRIIKESQAPFFKEVRDNLHRDGDVSEASALAMWEVLEKHDSHVLIWNVFPFHPHKRGDELTNRRPRQSELDLGKEFLHDLISIFKPKQIFAVGRVSESILSGIFSEDEFEYIRHPSYGGKAEFVEKLSKVLKRV